MTNLCFTKRTLKKNNFIIGWHCKLEVYRDFIWIIRVYLSNSFQWKLKDLPQFRLQSKRHKQTGKTGMRSSLSSPDGIRFIMEWTHTKLLSLVFAQTVSPTKPQWFLVLCPEGHQCTSCHLFCSLNEHWLPATNSLTWLAMINMQCGSLLSSRRESKHTRGSVEK